MHHAYGRTSAAQPLRVYSCVSLLGPWGIHKRVSWQQEPLSGLLSRTLC